MGTSNTIFLFALEEKKNNNNNNGSNRF